MTYKHFKKASPPHFLFEKDTITATTKKRIYAVNKFKKTVLVCNSSYTNKTYLHFWEVEKINELIKGAEDED